MIDCTLNMIKWMTNFDTFVEHVDNNVFCVHCVDHKTMTAFIFTGTLESLKPRLDAFWLRKMRKIPIEC